MEEIIEQLEKGFLNELYNPFAPKTEVQFNGGSIWIDSYNEADNTFVVSVDHDNRNESPNVEEYLSKALADRIDIADAIYEREQENEREIEEEYRTRYAICRSNGWPINF